MSKPKEIKIAKARGFKAKFLVITKFDDQYYHYQLTDLSTVNKRCDIGVWREKEKI